MLALNFQQVKHRRSGVALYAFWLGGLPSCGGLKVCFLRVSVYQFVHRSGDAWFSDQDGGFPFDSFLVIGC